jgi:urea transport system substrate-binding protein
MPSPVSIGIVHSLHGPMALSEAALVDAALLAVEEVNARGGVLGRNVNAVVADGKSDPLVFQSRARQLI